MMYFFYAFNRKRKIYLFYLLFSESCFFFGLLQSLSGHSSGIDSVSFDSSEVLVAAGAASGTIKLWDLEEAKSMYAVACSFPLMILKH